MCMLPCLGIVVWVMGLFVNDQRSRLHYLVWEFLVVRLYVGDGVWQVTLLAVAL